MGIEIERKFLVRPGLWTPRDAGEYIRQGYLAGTDTAAVRVRVRADRAYLTVKGPTTGLSRLEFEYAVPVPDAMEMLDTLCAAVIEKHRHLESHGGRLWEIDVFHAANEGLVVAEVELPSEDAPFEKPAWAGDEVSADRRYRNSQLAQVPFSTWAAGGAA